MAGGAKERMVGRLVGQRERETYRRTRPIIEKRAAGGKGFTGRGYAPDGSVTTGLDSDPTSPWVVYDSTSNTFFQSAGPPAVPWPEGQIWFRKLGISGDLVVYRL